SDLTPAPRARSGEATRRSGPASRPQPLRHLGRAGGSHRRLCARHCRRASMRIVFVATEPPSRQRPRSFVFATQLARPHTPSVITRCRTPRDIADVGKLQALGLHVVPVYEEAGPATARAAGAVFGETPVEVAFADAPRLRIALWGEIERGDVGVVHVEGVHAA